MKITVFPTIALLCLKFANCVICSSRQITRYKNGDTLESEISPTCTEAKKTLARVCLETENLHDEINKLFLKNYGEDSSLHGKDYVFYIFGVLILLMMIAIVGLSALLCRTKLRDYKVFATPTSPDATGNTNIRKYITQASHEMSLLNINSMQDSTKTIKESSSKNDRFPNNVIKNDLTESTPQPKNTLKIYKSVKKPVDHQMLLREQMKKICDDALARSQNSGITASLKDLNQLLNDCESVARQKSYENITREKSASFPQLDLYDAPPARNNSVMKCNENEEIDAPVYECFPTSNNIIIEDYDTNYLMTLSEDDSPEPFYINAKNRYK